MGAVPKKKPSLSRQRTKTSAWAAQFKFPNLIRCKNCGKVKLSHRACRECGYYNGRQVIEGKTKVRKI